MFVYFDVFVYFSRSYSTFPLCSGTTLIEIAVYWDDNCGSNFEAHVADIEARLVVMIQAPAPNISSSDFLKFRMKYFHIFCDNFQRTVC